MDNKKDIKILNKAVTGDAIDRINKRLAKKHFHYEKEGELFSFDYMIQILPETKKMMSVGNWYEYNLISVILFNPNKMFKTLINMVKNNLDENNGVYNFTDYFERLHLFEIKNKIHFVMDMININRIQLEQVLINSSELEENEPQIEDMDSPESLNEHKMSRLGIRTVIKDIVKILKNEDEGSYSLPEDADGNHYYNFPDIKSEFYVELNINYDESLEEPFIDGGFYRDEELIVIDIDVNPLNLQQKIYYIIGELNDTMAHELEHLNQFATGSHDLSDKSGGNPFKYYTQPHEVDAQKKGFRRLSKLTRQPYEKVVKNWFDTHKPIHKLTDDEVSNVLQQLL